MNAQSATSRPSPACAPLTSISVPATGVQSTVAMPLRITSASTASLPCARSGVGVVAHAGEHRPGADEHEHGALQPDAIVGAGPRANGRPPLQLIGVKVAHRLGRR